MKRIATKLKDGKLSVGIQSKGALIAMNALGKAGYDFVVIDMMWGTLAWESLHHNILAARQANLAPLVRIDAFPWAEGGDDRRIAVETAHAFSLGAGGVCASVSSVGEVMQMSKAMADGHQMGDIPLDPKLRSHREERTLGIFPIIESTEAYRDLEKILDVPGVVAPFLGCTDLAKQAGHPFDPEHPEVWRLVDKAVHLAAQRGKTIMANTSFPFNTMASMTARIDRLHEHGVNIVMMQPDYFVLYCASKEVLDGLRDRKQA